MQYIGMQYVERYDQRYTSTSLSFCEYPVCLLIQGIVQLRITLILTILTGISRGHK